MGTGNKIFFLILKKIAGGTELIRLTHRSVTRLGIKGAFLQFGVYMTHNIIEGFRKFRKNVLMQETKLKTNIEWL